MQKGSRKVNQVDLVDDVDIYDMNSKGYNYMENVLETDLHNYSKQDEHDFSK